MLGIETGVAMVSTIAWAGAMEVVAVIADEMVSLGSMMKGDTGTHTQQQQQGVPTTELRTPRTG